MKYGNLILRILGAFVLLSLVPLPATARNVVEPARQCLVETGHCIEGRFLEFWLQNGGREVFGFPITPARMEHNRDSGAAYLTQWFERNRFELHPENVAPYDVLLGRLADERLKQLGADWRRIEGSYGMVPRDCLQFLVEQTTHRVCDQAEGAGFATYWRTHGLRDPRLSPYEQSPALFGLPITWPRMERNASGATVVTQWFERARFEWHPNNPPGYQVLLGRLGDEVRQGGRPRPLTYFWPKAMPRGLMVQHAQSFATEWSFTLQLAEPGGQFDVTINGGLGWEPSERPGGRRVTVRGQPGILDTTGAGASLFWMEDGQPYAIVGSVDVVKLAAELEALDLHRWYERLDRVH